MKNKDVENREPNETRLKPDPVDQPVRSARTFVQYYNGTQYCSTETVLLISSLPQTNITSQMWLSESKARGEYKTFKHSTSCSVTLQTGYCRDSSSYNISQTLTVTLNMNLTL